MAAGFRSTFGFGQLDNLQQQMMQPAAASPQNDTDAAQMMQMAHAQRVPAAAPPPQGGQQPVDPSVPPSDVGTVQTGLPKYAPPTTDAGGGSTLSALFAQLFGA